MGWWDSIVNIGQSIGSGLSTAGSYLMSGIDSVIDAGADILKSTGELFGIGDVADAASKVSETGGGLDKFIGGMSSIGGDSDFLSELTSIDTMGVGEDMLGGMSMIPGTDYNSFLSELIKGNADTAGILTSDTSSLTSAVPTSSGGIWNTIKNWAGTKEGKQVIGQALAGGALTGLQYLLENEKAGKTAKEKEKDREMYKELQEMRNENTLDAIKAKADEEERLYKLKQ